MKGLLKLTQATIEEHFHLLIQGKKKEGNPHEKNKTIAKDEDIERKIYIFSI